MQTERILVNPTETELAFAVEDNLYALFRAMAALPGAQLVETDALSYHYAFPTNTIFKGVWNTRLTPENADRVIDDTLAWFQEAGAPYLFWWTSKRTTPGDIGERLMARGLISYEVPADAFAPGVVSTDLGAPCMVADLRRLDEALLGRVPPGFKIEIAQDETALYDFRQVFMTSFNVPEWSAQAWVDATLTLGINHAPWTIYVGRLDDEPVACTLLFNGGGVASVYGVGTIPSARGKGIGAAITLKPLLDAWEMGYRYGVLFATKMGVPVYERIGFHLAPIRLNRYLWRARS
jgi:GNAT superfamily N-acetyltransferase